MNSLGFSQNYSMAESGHIEDKRSSVENVITGAVLSCSNGRFLSIRIDLAASAKYPPCAKSIVFPFEESLMVMGFGLKHKWYVLLRIHIISTSRKLKEFPKTGVRAYARTPVFGTLLVVS
jgi:hypothetical protein